MGPRSARGSDPVAIEELVSITGRFQNPNAVHLLDEERRGTHGGSKLREDTGRMGITLVEVDVDRVQQLRRRMPWLQGGPRGKKGSDPMPVGLLSSVQA